MLRALRLLVAAALFSSPAIAADVRLSDTPLVTILSGNETLPVVLQDGKTLRRATLSQLIALAAWDHWRGAWSAAANYAVNDFVERNGSTYIATAANINQEPPNVSYWDVVASKGADGAGIGTVTSVTCGTGLTGGTFTVSGTCALSAPVTVARGGTNATSASGTAIDNISGWSATGFIKRIGSGTYAFIADPLPVTSGGTGLASGTSGGVLCFTATTTIASSALLTQYALLLGAGAGACPTAAISLGTTMQLLHGAAAGPPTWGPLVYGDIASAAIASGAEVQSNTASKLATPNALWSAGAVTALTDAATIGVDLSTGINFSVTLAANRTLGNPTNTKVGQSGAIRVAQDATGSRTLNYGANYKWASGTACVLSTAASKIDYLFYFVYSSTEIMLSCSLDVR